MVIKFGNDYMARLYTGQPLKGKPRFSEGVVTKFKKTILILKRVSDLIELSKLRGMHFEPLKGEKAGHYSVRVDDTYRVEFRIIKDTFEILLVEELSKHYK